MSSNRGPGVEFPEGVVKKVWRETVGVGDDLDLGICRCARKEHGHVGVICAEIIMWDKRETEWQAHHKVRREDGGKGTEENCEIICVACHSQITAEQAKRDKQKKS